MKKNMKKLWALALATALSVACIGCGNQTESKKNTRESIDVQTDSDATQADTSEPVDRKSTRLNSSHIEESRMPSSA